MSDNLALIIEDTDANRIFFERLIKQAGFDILSASSGQEGLGMVEKSEKLALAIVDMQIPDMSGLEITMRLRAKFPDTCIIIATMHDERSLMESAFGKGCDVFLVKPHGFMDLFKRLTTAGCESLHEERPIVIDQHGPRQFSNVFI